MNTNALENPLQYVLSAGLLTVLMTVSLGVMTSLVVAGAFRLGSQTGLLSLTIVMGIAFWMVQESILYKSFDTAEAAEEVSEASVSQKFLNLIASGLLYNSMVVVGTVYAMMAMEVYGMTVAIGVAAAYGHLEKISMEFAVPFTVGGFLVWAISMVYVISAGSQLLLQSLRDRSLSDLVRLLSQSRSKLERVEKIPLGVFNPDLFSNGRTNLK